MLKRILEFGAEASATFRMRITLCPILIIATLFVCFSLLSSQRVYAIEDNGVLKIHSDNSGKNLTPQEILEENGVPLTAADDVIPTKLDASGSLNSLEIIRPYNVTIKADGKTLVCETTGESVLSLLSHAGISLATMDSVYPDASTPSYDGMVINVSRQSYSYAEVLKTVPFKTVTKNSKEIDRGVTKQVSPGKNGINKLVYEIKLHDGKEISRRLISESVVEKPVSAQQLKGTGGVLAVNHFKAGYTKTPVNLTALSFSRVLECRATAYTDTGYNTATGTTPRIGTIAVDPKVIKLGTKLFICSPDGKWVYGYCVAEDTGGAIKGNKVDIYFNTYAECIQFGRRTVAVYVLE